MSQYIKSTDFAVKDGLTTGDPNKIIKGTEINTELNDISTAIASKADTNSPVFTGNPTAPTQSVGTNNTRIATTAFVEATLNAVQSNVNITGGDIDNVDITGGTITGLVTDLAVADGGTGASTFTTNNVVLGNGTSSLAGNTVAPGTSGNVLTSNGTTWQSTAPAPVIGTGQTWQDVLSSRAANTTYTNTTSRPIFISVGGSGAPNHGTMSMTIDGVVIGRQGFTAIASGVSNATMSAIVPVNSTYRVDNILGWTLEFWAELR
jgi:hypothetical protein